MAATMRRPAGVARPMAAVEWGLRPMESSARSARRAKRAASLSSFVVIESTNPAADAHRRRALDAARASGSETIAGWLAPRGRVTCHGDVASDADAVLALRAAVAGASLVIVARATRETIDRLVDDLRRLGPVEHVTADVPAPPTVDVQQRRLLRMLAEGWTLGEAATELGLARRTADRRLDAARRALGADRTADALARARQLGWLDPIGVTD